MATVACSDRPTRNSSSLSPNGLPPVRQTAIAPLTVLPASSGATIRRSFSSCSVPGIWIARGSASASLMNSARPLCDEAADDALADVDHRGLDCRGDVADRDDRPVGLLRRRSGRKMALLPALSRSFAWRAMRSITVGRSSVDEMSRPTSASAAVSRVRRWVSSKRRAFSSATLMLLASVCSRRTSEALNACSRSMSIRLIEPARLVACDQRHENRRFLHLRAGQKVTAMLFHLLRHVLVDDQRLAGAQHVGGKALVAERSGLDGDPLPVFVQHTGK